MILNNNITDNNPGLCVAVDSNGVVNNSGFVVNYNNFYGNGTNSTYANSSSARWSSTQSVYDRYLRRSQQLLGQAPARTSGDGPGTGDSCLRKRLQLNSGNWRRR